MKSHLVILYSHSPSRLSHLRKLKQLKSLYIITIIAAKVPKWFEIEGFCHHVIHASLSVTNENIDSINLNLRSLSPVDGIINLSEPFLPVHHLLAEFHNVIGPSAEMVEFGRHKYNMRKLADELDIPVPQYREVTASTLEKLHELRFPIVIKPIIGSGSTLVQSFNSYEDLVERYEVLSNMAKTQYSGDSQFNEVFVDEYPFIAEELIGGDLLYQTELEVKVGEISVESLYVNGEVYILAIHDKPLPNNGPYFEEVGYTTPSRLPKELQMQAYDFVSRIHQRLGKGCFVLHTEFRTFSDGLVLLEFGVRMGGAAIYNSLLASTGIDFLEEQIDIVLNKFSAPKNVLSIPTVTFFLFPVTEGEILSIRGESHLISSPYYVEHQIYDDVGDIALRAPKAGRSTMHCIFSALDEFESFSNVEKAALRATESFEIRTAHWEAKSDK